MEERERVEALGEAPGGGEARLREDVDERLARCHDALDLERRLARDAIEEIVRGAREHLRAAVVGEPADRQPGDGEQRHEERRDVDGEWIPPASAAGGEAGLGHACGSGRRTGAGSECSGLGAVCSACPVAETRHAALVARIPRIAPPLPPARLRRRPRRRVGRRRAVARARRECDRSHLRLRAARAPRAGDARSQRARTR